MTASAQTIWALLLLAGCILPFLHMARPRSHNWTCVSSSSPVVSPG